MIKQKTEYTYFCDTEEEVKSLVLFLFSINKDISYIVKSVKRKDIGANQAEYMWYICGNDAGFSWRGGHHIPAAPTI